MNDSIRKWRVQSRFGYAMGTNFLCFILWFLMGWPPTSLAQIVIANSTAFLAAEAVVDWKHKPQDLTNT